MIKRIPVATLKNLIEILENINKLGHNIIYRLLTCSENIWVERKCQLRKITRKLELKFLHM